MKRYIAIDLEAMRKNNLNFEKWAFLENVYFMSNNDYHVCYASKKTLSEHLCISERQVFKIISELERDGLLTKNDFGHLKVTNKWLKVSCIDYAENADTVQKSDDTYAENADDPMQNLHTKRENLRELLREKKRVSKDTTKKEEFSFELSRETQYSNLSEEYKLKLRAKCLLIDGDINRYEDFILSLKAKGYKYKDFTLVYKMWDKEKKYKNFTPSPEPKLGDDWVAIRVGHDKVIAINTKTLETKEGIIRTEEELPPPQHPQTYSRDTFALLRDKGLTA